MNTQLLSSKDTTLSRKQRRTFVIWFTIGLSIIIGYLTLTPTQVPPGLSGSDKLYHFLAFFGLTFPCAVIYPRALLRVMLAAILFGAAIEIVQPYVGRSREFADFVADSAGVVFAALLGWPLHKLIVKKREHAKTSA